MSATARYGPHGSDGSGGGAAGGTGNQAHAPVMLAEVSALLAPALTGRSAVALDATVGMGGHAERLLREHRTLRLVGLDRDRRALDISRARLASFGARVSLVHAVYDAIPAVLADLAIPLVDGVLFDLGVSSLQIDTIGRGFAYSRDAPLDMRMDQGSGITAADIVRDYPVRDLARILRSLGEERYAARIADAIDRERARTPITSSAQLARLIAAAVPAAAAQAGGHPAKRTFQALRIEVNAELALLATAVPAAVDALAGSGRIVVLSYHSLEDRIVKQCFAEQARDRTPIDLPVPLPQHAPRLRLLTHGVRRPSEGEIARNPRAASARLRAAERIGAVG